MLDIAFQARQFKNFHKIQFDLMSAQCQIVRDIFIRINFQIKITQKYGE